MYFTYKNILGFIMCFNLAMADSKKEMEHSKKDSAHVVESNSKLEKGQSSKENWLNTTKKNLKILLNMNDLVEDAKCDESWQKKVCDGSMMCYTTKCFYPQADIEMMHRIFLENLVTYLKHNHSVRERDRIAHLSNIMNLGLPEDNREHNYVFINSYNVECTYTLWQKNSKTLFFDLSGCLKEKNQKMTRTLIQDDLGVIELYEHIAY